MTVLATRKQVRDGERAPGGGDSPSDLHSGDGSLFGARHPHRELGYAFADIGADPKNKV